jgi:hemerythrin-like domain-containing protein
MAFPGGCRPEPRATAEQREQGGMRFLDFLMDEHRAFGTMLDVLDAMAAKLARGNDVPLDMLTDVVDFFERFSNQHHMQEEHLLFPLLAKHGIGADQTVVSALTSQHEAGRMYGARMRVEVGLMRDGASGVAASFASDAAAYSELIREHIRIEDEYFYALADRVLTPAEHERIAAQLERAANDPAAHAARVRYLGMLETCAAIVAGWAVDR